MLVVKTGALLYRGVRRVKNVFHNQQRFHGRVTLGPVTETLPEICALDYDRLNNHKSVHEFSLREPEKFWNTLARNRLEWMQDYDTVLEADFDAAKFRWFSGGKLNVTVNCLDRHVRSNPGKTALIWEKDEPGQEERISYEDVLKMTCQMGNLLRSVGVGKGDRVVIYLPVSPLAVAAMLGCARIGAIHSVVFAGFSSEALAARIDGAKASVVITANEALRGGKTIPLKSMVDKAVEMVSCVKDVFVMQRTPTQVPMTPHRDHHLQHEMSKQSTTCEPEAMESEDPLFMLYTSGSTGKPKGIVHTQAGYLLYGMVSQQLCFDVRAGDVWGCVADVGWITGHTYVVYAPLANGVASVLFESVPSYPDPGRYWETVQRLKMTQFYGAPTALRFLIRYGDEWVRKYDRSSLRVLGSVGEPINQEAWEWFHDVVGEGRCMLVDTWWQSETGGICITPSPADPNSLIKKGMAMRPFYGIQPVLMDESKQPITTSPAHGALCLASPWPGMARTIYGDHQRFIDTYFIDYPGVYFTGDGASRDEDGDIQITGRMDDVINVSGHRLGTAEIEDALDEHEDAAESAVVSFPHPIKGEGIFAFVVLKESTHLNMEDTKNELRDHVKTHIGKFAIPDHILICDTGLPKTRSGKIMRRILRKIASGDSDDLGDTSTLADPSVVKFILTTFEKEFVQGK